MQDNDQRRMQLVWASVYLSAVTLIGATLIVVFNGGSPTEVAAGASFIAGTLAMVFNTVLLLTSDSSARLLNFAKRMIWFAFLCLTAGGVLGCFALANG